MRRALFSLVIPTHNKSKDLKGSVDFILSQAFKDYEILILDNNSKDKTEEVVKSYRDERIKYHRNKRNIGWIKNVEKGVNLAKGEYIILQGDDDYLISEKCLENLSRILRRKEYGFIRLNYLSRKNDTIFDFRFNKSFMKDMILKPNQNNDEVFNFIQKTDPYFMTGICFRNSFNKKINFIDSELAPWLNIIFYSAQKYGGYYSSRYSFVAKWVSKPIHPF